jgi:NADP-dependent 3-hydroxy acid dehydrogenase YdfG
MRADKIAGVFGAGEAIGSQVAWEFSKEEATVFLSGRHLSSMIIDQDDYGRISTDFKNVLLSCRASRH